MSRLQFTGCIAWLTFLPVRFGYWLIWAGAKMRNADAEDVWLSGFCIASLDLPPVRHLMPRAKMLDAIQRGKHREEG